MSQILTGLALSTEPIESTGSTGSTDPAAALPALAQLLRRHRQVVVLTGAGISTASGIPDRKSVV